MLLGFFIATLLDRSTTKMICRQTTSADYCTFASYANIECSVLSLKIFYRYFM